MLVEKKRCALPWDPIFHRDCPLRMSLAELTLMQNRFIQKWIMHVFVIFDANIRHLNEKRNGKRKVILPGSMVPDEHLSGRSCAMRVYCEWKAGRELQWEATTGVCAREQT